MIPSIFNKTDYEEILKRIDSLNENSQPLWGKMTVGQMLAHCQKPFEVVFGELKLKRGLIGFLFGGIARKSMAGEKPFKKNLPTAPGFVVKDNRNVEVEKKNLIEKINRFLSLKTEDLEAIVHPFFGKMTRNEWDRLTWKHLDHHLKQFGK